MRGTIERQIIEYYDTRKSNGSVELSSIFYFFRCCEGDMGVEYSRICFVYNIEIVCMYSFKLVALFVRELCYYVIHHYSHSSGRLFCVCKTNKHKC